MKAFIKVMGFLLCLVPLGLSGQQSIEILPLKTYKNEIGVDIVALTKLILDFNEASALYQATYPLSYKRHFNKFSLRFGFGGNSFSKDYEEPDFTRETLNDQRHDFRYRLGIEKQIPVGQRWHLYAGLDFRHHILYERDDYLTKNAFWLNGEIVNSNLLGLAPLLGIEFKINNRISLQMETSFLVYWLQSNYKPTSTAVLPSPTLPPVILPVSSEEKVETSFGTSFAAPNFLMLSIKLY